MSLEPSPVPRGVTPPSTPSGRGGFVSDVIVELGFVEREVVEQAVQAARTTGKSVARVLLDVGALDESQLARATAERHGLEYVDLDEFEIDANATNLVSPSAAGRYGALPIAFTHDGALVVAMSDPADGLAVSDISVMTRLEVRPAVATRARIEAALARVRGSGTAHPAPAGDEPPTPDQPSPGVVVWQAEPEGNGGREVAGREPVSSEAAPDVEQTPDLSAELERMRELAEERRREGEQRDEQIAALRRQLEGAGVEDGALEKARAETARLSAELEEARSRVDELEQAGAGVAARMAELESARERGEQRVADADRRVAEAGRRVAQTEERLAETEQRLEEADRRVEGADQRADEQIAALRGQLESADADRDALEDARAETRRLASELGEARSRAERLQQQSAELTGEVERLGSELERSRSRVRELEQAAAGVAARMAELESAEERAERSRLALAEFRKQREREEEMSARRERELAERVESEAESRQALQSLCVHLNASLEQMSELVRAVQAKVADELAATEQARPH
jgi:predicted  nucleic acid-binding Zn-ribbon protein